MYMNMDLSVKIRCGLNTVSANITLVNLHLTKKLLNLVTLFGCNHQS
jgi:hypothetical protein